MKFIRFKPNKKKTAKNMIFREKSNKFDKYPKETYLSKKEHLIILGLNASGKSTLLKKIYDQRDQVYIKAKYHIFIDAHTPISDWLYNNISETDHKHYIDTLNTDELKQRAMETIKRQYTQLKILTHKVRGSILFIDDIDLVTGRKREVIKELLAVCKVSVVTAKDYKKLDKSIEHFYYRRDHRILDLTTKQSYDATNYIFMSVIAIAFLNGMYEIGALLMVVKYGMQGVNEKK